MSEPDDDRGGAPDRDAGEDRRQSGLEHERLEEEHGLEALPVDAGEAEGRPGRESAAAAVTTAHTLLPPVEAGEMLGPVHAVVEPVEHEQQDTDRDQRDDRLERSP